MNSTEVLARIADTLEARKSAEAGKSYVAGLYLKGREAILKKVGEESAETIMAGMQSDRDAIVYEVADLWFHSMVLLAHANIRVEDVIAELARREGLSGLEEKAARDKT
jgi:phosphoribosyl-ATP pyrophosphohydrolase